MLNSTPLLRFMLLSGIVLLTLNACQRQSPSTESTLPVEPTQPAVAEITTEPEPDPVIEPPSPAAIPDVNEQVSSALAPEPEQELELDLRLPPDILNEGADTHFPEPKSEALPNLFAKKKQARTSVSGGLLFEEGEEVSLDTVNGASVTVKVPVN